jgi:glyoxylase-like metal-dependent hydrolase (beta-lactamase superfamily II)
MAAPTRSPREEAQPATEAIEEPAPGILRLQLPIHMPGLGHVNCYAMEDSRGWTVVDPGMPGPKSWKAMVARFADAGFSVRDVHTVVVTHSHIDHFGGAGRLRKEAGAEVVSSRSFRTWWDPDDVDDVDPWEGVEFNREGKPWDRETPWGGKAPRPPLKARLRFQLLRPLMKRAFATPSPSRRLDDAEVTTIGGREWVAVHTPGHTPDHLCLFDPAGGVLLSGDHVLPTITPHISGVDAGPDPLARFEDSLQKVKELDGVEHVLPAHGCPFHDLGGRVDDIHRHHGERLEKLRTHLGEVGEASVTELMQQLFRPQVWGPMAESETYAHLEHLRLAGDAARREVDAPDDEGKFRYSLV